MIYIMHSELTDKFYFVPYDKKGNRVMKDKVDITDDVKEIINSISDIQSTEASQGTIIKEPNPDNQKQ